MEFLTGCTTKPVLGVSYEATVELIHDCLSFRNGVACKCLTVFSICGISVTLPAHIADDVTMMRAFVDAVFNPHHG